MPQSVHRIAYIVEWMDFKHCFSMHTLKIQKNLTPMSWTKKFLINKKLQLKKSKNADPSTDQIKS